MEKKNKYIETLLECFFEGQTSNEEERQLYRFFKQETIPDELAQYKPVIQYFESGLADELEIDKNAATQKETGKPSVEKQPDFVGLANEQPVTQSTDATKRQWFGWTTNKRSKTQPTGVVKVQPAGVTKTQPAGLAKKQWLVWGSVAASALLVLFTSIYVFDRIELADPYAGSYIIRNGVRITDLNLIKPELEAAIQKSLLIEQEAEQLIDRLTAIDDSQEVEISQRFQEHNQRILDNTQDENKRNEVEKMLNEIL